MVHKAPLLQLNQIVDIYVSQHKDYFAGGKFISKGIVEKIESCGYMIRFLQTQAWSSSIDCRSRSDRWWYSLECGEAESTPFYIHKYSQYKLINTLTVNTKKAFKGVLDHI